ncbi:hypothetical protein [Streptomyces sp. CB02261]|uniref:hypothetical protein n=1 Tax=Streptomyces sp. CB02261 TaxID=1703940 RepID=UPI00093C2D0C|nr:hypothetical protein [Streptomyces sp. CB02261]OKJ52560.1 hypothetical protein AMK29_30520 [Streptomyces sp. CB02261]
MTDTIASSTPLITGPVQQYIEALLRRSLDDRLSHLERIEQLEKDGHRIIDAGQTYGEAWEITDWRTGELIERGIGGDKGYDMAVRRLDPAGKWILHENVDNDDDQEAVEPVGVPASFADLLQDWLSLTSTPDEDVAAVVGWSVEEVARHREED